MAVIQDLPAEIFRRILELGAGDWKCLRGRDLCSAALVARAWTQPSQELLVYHWWSPHLPNAPIYETSPPPTRQIRSVMVNSPEAAAMLRRLVERHKTNVCDLDVCDLYSASDLAVLLMNGVKHLSLDNGVQHDFILPSNTQLALESLYLNSKAPLTSQFWAELADKAPRLARLEVWGVEPFPSTLMAPLLTFAPQLRRLDLSFPFSRFRVGGFDYTTYLRACASLVHLDLTWLGPGDLPTLLSSVSSRLKLLVCSFMNSSDADKTLSNDLLGALNQPALANLERWRWVDRHMDSEGDLVSYRKDTVQRWEAACRARGIEPRGKERYFTD